MSNLERARFARLVRRALMDLPPEFGRRMRNVEIVVDEEPEPGRVADGRELLGLYEGVPLTERAYAEPYVPDRISIYRGPIQRVSTSPRRQAAIVRETVMHEIAHHFGISGESLAELGRGDAD